MTAKNGSKSTRQSRARRGQIIIMTALLIPVLGSFMGLAIDVGMFYHVKRRLQTSADAGAIGAAQEMWRQNTKEQATAAARNDVKLNGFDDDNVGDDDPTVTVAVNNPPSSGARAGDAGFVEVIVTQNLPTYFMRFANRSTMTVRARAVAGLIPYADGCVMALNPTLRGALDIVGTATLTANCGVMVNSNDDLAIRANGGGCIYSDEVGVSGGYTMNGSANCIYPTPVVEVPPALDPLKYLPEPILPDPLTPASAVALNYKHQAGDPDDTMEPGIYLSGITITGGKVTMAPGTYVIAGGDFMVDGAATVVGEGVTIYLTNGPKGWGDVQIAGTATVKLTAPTSGDYAGVLIYRDPRAPDRKPGSFLAGTEESYLTGAVYIPSGSVRWSGTSDNADWTMIIADNITITGDAVVKGGFTSSAIPPPTRKAMLVE